MNEVSRLSVKLRKTLDFFRIGIWRLDAGSMPIFRSIAVRLLRVVYMTVEPLCKEDIHLRASSLTFYSLLSIVPVLAMFFGLAKGFGLDKLLEKSLLARVQGQEEVFTRMIEFSKRLLESTQGGLVAGAGLVLLFWSVIRIFGSIEKNFNQIWGVAKERPLIRKATDYLALSLLCAVLAAGSSTLTVMIKSEATAFVAKVNVLAAISPAIFLLVSLLPVVALWILFTLIYLVMPNTNVHFTSAAIAGTIAGTAFQVFQIVYIDFQIGVAKYNAIYGSFAALPLFLVWLQLSWLIVLVGAHLSFAYQNSDRFQLLADPSLISQRLRGLLALLVSTIVVKRFCSGETPVGAKEISEEIKMPLALIRHILDKLAACGVLVRLKFGADGEEPYQPAVHTNRLTIHFVMSRMDRCGPDELPITMSGSYSKLSDAVEKLNLTISSSPDNLLLQDI